MPVTVHVAPFKQGEFEQAFVSYKRNLLDKYLRYFFVIILLVILNFRLYVFRFFPYSNFSLMFLLVFFDVFVDIIKIKLLQLSFLYFIYQTNLLINEFFYSNILLLGSKFFYFVLCSKKSCIPLILLF